MLRLITGNWQLKLMSLGFSLILWFFVMGERRMEVGYTVPLELYNVPKDLVVVNEVPNTVDIRLSGPRAVLSDLDEKEIRISVNLAGLKPGLTTFTRLDEHLRLPVGIRTTRISPAYFDVRLERVIDKEVAVRPYLAGRPATGYRLVATEVAPLRVTVSGAESEVRPLNEVMTDRIDIEGLKSSQEFKVSLGYRGKNSRLKDVDKVSVYLRIVPEGPSASAKKASKG